MHKRYEEGDGIYGFINQLIEDDFSKSQLKKVCDEAANGRPLVSIITDIRYDDMPFSDQLNNQGYKFGWEQIYSVGDCFKKVIDSVTNYYMLISIDHQCIQIINLCSGYWAFPAQYVDDVTCIPGGELSLNELIKVTREEAFNILKGETNE